jgi:Tfp pilus assembly PilM family ATPase
VATRYLQLAQPHTTGIALSDTTLRFVKFSEHDGMAIPEHAAELQVPEGVLENGRVVNKQKFISFLKTARKIHRFENSNVVLISPQVQTFSISAKGAAPLYIKEAVEKLFKLPAKDILYEYHAIGGDEGLTTFQVTTILKAVSQKFISCFKAAELRVVGIESIGHALSRALLPTANGHKTAMIVSVDSDITTIVIAVNGKVSQTTMFAFGDDVFTDALMEGRDITKEQANRLKYEQGLTGEDSKMVFDRLNDDCTALVHHINEEYITWHSANKNFPVLEHIYLTGAGSAVKGLDEYISIELRVPVTIANVWANCLSLDEFVPTLPQLQAINYAAAIGVALTSNDSSNISPVEHKQTLQRKQVATSTGKLVLSFILGVVVGFAVARIIAIPSIHGHISVVLHKIQAQW